MKLSELIFKVNGENESYVFGDKTFVTISPLGESRRIVKMVNNLTLSMDSFRSISKLKTLTKESNYTLLRKTGANEVEHISFYSPYAIEDILTEIEKARSRNEIFYCLDHVIVRIEDIIAISKEDVDDEAN